MSRNLNNIPAAFSFYQWKKRVIIESIQVLLSWGVSSQVTRPGFPLYLSSRGKDAAAIPLPKGKNCDNTTNNKDILSYC
jgi:hypothetical protein